MIISRRCPSNADQGVTGRRPVNGSHGNYQPGYCIAVSSGRDQSALTLQRHASLLRLVNAPILASPWPETVVPKSKLLFNASHRAPSLFAFIFVLGPYCGAFPISVRGASTVRCAEVHLCHKSARVLLRSKRKQGRFEWGANLVLNVGSSLFLISFPIPLRFPG